MHKEKTMNEIVQEKMGQLLLSICEAELLLSENEIKIKALEQKISELENGSKKT